VEGVVARSLHDVNSVFQDEGFEIGGEVKGEFVVLYSDEGEEGLVANGALLGLIRQSTDEVVVLLLAEKQAVEPKTRG